MNKNMPLVSIIMGVYNDADSLEMSLDSIESKPMRIGNLLYVMIVQMIEVKRFY